jgi:transcriptional regulator with XRE-family HTH domain
VAANLSRLRAISGLSQENLSLRAKLSRNHVHSIEKAERLPEIDIIYKLAGALGVDPIELLPGFYWRPDESGGDGTVTDEPPERG